MKFNMIFWSIVLSLFASFNLTMFVHGESLTLIAEETRLMRHLLNEKTYLKKVRPSHQVIVDIRFVYNQIVSMVEKEQIIVSNCFVDQKWTDPRLVWNPNEFHNISWIRISATSVWYPDTFLYNTADNAGFLLPQDSQNVIVSHNGTVFWPLPLAQLRTRCRMVIKYFPFDEQTCDMIFGSWSHTSSLIHYRFWEKTPELPQYTPNNEWKLLAVSQSIKTVEYPNWIEPDTFFEINFSILIVRKPLQAIYNTLVPALMLTTLTLVSFFIPFPQEMQIGISIMLAYSVFSLRLSEDVPSQSDSVHLISLYLTVCMFFSLSAMTWFAVVNKLREKKRLPYWLRWFVLNYVSKLVAGQTMGRKARRALQLAEQQLSLTATIDLTDNENLAKNNVIKIPIETEKSLTTNRLTTNESFLNSSTVWVRRSMMKNSTHFDRSLIDSSSNINKKKGQDRSTIKHRASSSNKNQESLYAIHIINRFVFVLFLSLVIGFNIYTWFFYPHSIQTKLFDNETVWICFDEKKLSIVHCNETI